MGGSQIFKSPVGLKGATMYIEEKAKEVGDLIFHKYKKGDFGYFGNKDDETRIYCSESTENNSEDCIKIKLLPCDHTGCHIHLRYREYDTKGKSNEILMLVPEILKGLHESKLAIKPVSEDLWWTPIPPNQIFVPLEKLSKEILNIILDWKKGQFKTEPE